MHEAADPLVRVVGLTMAFGDEVVQRDLAFDIRRGEVLAIVGASGCGKSTLLRHLIGLQTPAAGQVLYGDQDLHQAEDETLAVLRRRFGVMFQAGALWSSMTVGENVMLPLRLFTDTPADERERLARWKLALVGLDDAFELEPAELSGGMRKRAAIARALALDVQRADVLYEGVEILGDCAAQAAELGATDDARALVDETLTLLERAVASGFSDVERLTTEPSLRAVRGEARFAALVERLRGAR